MMFQGSSTTIRLIWGGGILFLLSAFGKGSRVIHALMDPPLPASSLSPLGTWGRNIEIRRQTEAGHRSTSSSALLLGPNKPPRSDITGPNGSAAKTQSNVLKLKNESLSMSCKTVKDKCFN